MEISSEAVLILPCIFKDNISLFSGGACCSGKESEAFKTIWRISHKSFQYTDSR